MPISAEFASGSALNSCAISLGLDSPRVRFAAPSPDPEGVNLKQTKQLSNFEYNEIERPDRLLRWRDRTPPLGIGALI
jgi:hypothetical protein